MTREGRKLVPNGSQKVESDNEQIRLEYDSKGFLELASAKELLKRHQEHARPVPITPEDLQAVRYIVHHLYSMRLDNKCLTVFTNLMDDLGLNSFNPTTNSMDNLFHLLQPEQWFQTEAWKQNLDEDGSAKDGEEEEDRTYSIPDDDQIDPHLKDPDHNNDLEAEANKLFN